jgi:hypothetical protein
MRDPETEHLLVPRRVDANDQVDGFVLDVRRLTDFHHQGIKVKERVDRIQRTGLPGFHLVCDGVGDRGDQRGRDFDLINFLQVLLNLAGRHAACI